MKRVIDVLTLPPQQSSSSSNLADPTFSSAVIAWQKQHGRHALPWQNTRDAYRIWLSEIMLQQTQVAAVIPYYERFLVRFPDVVSLASAPTEDVMAHWSGLGYYTRARNLHRCAQQIVAEYGSVFPSDPELLAGLPGIGRSTAAAISAFAYGTRAAILDGNVKRVFARVFGVDGYPGQKQIEDQLWLRAVALLPNENIGAYTQGLMDLGATICTRSSPSCLICPLSSRCVALATHRVQELPVRKPKKNIPEKQVSMLVIVDQNQVLLVKRPDTGIWGGLLSLPEMGGFTNLNDNVPDAAITNTQLTQVISPFGTHASCERLPTFSHGFTHFKLHISPYQVSLARRLDISQQTSYVWMDADKLVDAPLPAPVKKLLLAVCGAADIHEVTSV